MGRWLSDGSRSSPRRGAAWARRARELAARGYALALMSPSGASERLVEVAKTAAFLLSDDAGYITGQNILVDGGVNRAI